MLHQYENNSTIIPISLPTAPFTITTTFHAKLSNTYCFSFSNVNDISHQHLYEQCRDLFSDINQYDIDMLGILEYNLATYPDTTQQAAKHYYSQQKVHFPSIPLP